MISLVHRPRALLHAELAHGRRLLLLTTGDASDVADALCEQGFGRSSMTVLSRVGGPDEARTEGTAECWQGTPHDPLAVVAVECVGVGHSRLAGLPDDVFDHDGALTKSEVRAITLAALGPRPGELLWDVGAGSGSIAVEWMRCHPSCRAIAVEARADRCVRIAHNARVLGVPDLEVVEGEAPAALPAGRPDAVFIGGGLTAVGVVEACLAARPARLVANVVTIGGEASLARLAEAHGGTLRRIAISRAEPLGGFLAYKPAIPVTQWRWHG